MKIASVAEDAFEHMARLRELSLSQNPWDFTLNGSTFDFLEELVSLQLSATKPSGTLTSRPFRELRNLVNLELADCNIHTLMRDTFQVQSQLLSLNLDGNDLTQLPENVFSSLKQLQTLTMKTHSIQVLQPGSLSGLTNLRDLNMNGGQLQHLARGSLDPIRGVRHLSLSRNLLTEMASGVFTGSFANLKSLALDNNQITYISPGAFAGLPQLEVFRLEGNPAFSVCTMTPLLPSTVECPAPTAEESEAESSSSTDPTMVIVGCLLALLIILAAVFLTRFYESKARERRRITEQIEMVATPGTADIALSSEEELEAQFPRLASSENQQRWRKLTILPNRVELKPKQLGQGAFGEVFLGQLLRRGKDPLPVAVKTLRRELPFSDRVQFVMEARLMSLISHPNLLRLEGVVLQGPTVMILTELMERGDLKGVLREARASESNAQLSFSQLLNIASELCNALE